MEKRLGSFGGKLDSLITSVQTLQSTQSKTVDTLATLNATVKRQAEKVDALEREVVSLKATDNRVRALEQEIMKDRKRLQETAASCDGARQEVQDVHSRLDKLHRELQGVREIATSTQTKSPPRGCSSKSDSHSGITASSKEQELVTFQDMQEMVREESEQRERADCVILSGLTETSEEDLRRLVISLNTKLQDRDVVDVYRLGKQPSKGPKKPRLVRARLSAAGKRILLQSRTSLSVDGCPVYVNHDLTRTEQQRRKAALPSYKQLRAKGVLCSLPRDRIMLKGKVNVSRRHSGGHCK